jgi:esterase/lipase superfamily enzyme
MVPLENRALSCGKALVTNVTGDPATLEQQQVAAVSGVTQDFFSEALQAEIVNSGKNLLVFVHGFANRSPAREARTFMGRKCSVCVCRG